MNKDNYIAIQFNSLFCDTSLIANYEKELAKYSISLKTRDLNGCIMHAALDFIDYDLIALGYSLLQSMVFSGCYDILKNIILKMWETIGSHNSRVPFTIKINGIPTENGNENISCKIEGGLSSKQKDDVLEKTFALANSISNNTFKLKEKSIFYNTFNAHVFQVNPNDYLFSEIDIEEEIRKKREDK